MERVDHRPFYRAVVFMLMFVACRVFAGDYGTPPEARTMLLQAIAHYRAVGRKQALADFNARKPAFSDRDLYVFCLGPDHTVVANGGFPNLIETGRLVDRR